MADESRKIYAVQFHPEVHHSVDGERYAYPTRIFFEEFAKEKCPIIIGLDVHADRAW